MNVETSPGQETSTMDAMPDLSVVIPLYNEEESIAALLDEVARHLKDKTAYEIIVVDDGSSDNSAGVLKQLLRDAHYPLRVIRHAANYGQSSALHTGIRAARASWVATLDADGQNNPADIMLLLEARNNSPLPNLKLVNGYRKKRQDNIIKIISSRVANHVRGRILHDMTPDTGCGLKLIHKDTFLQLPFFDHMHRFIPALMKRAGAAFVSVQVSHRPRAKGKSKYTLHNRLWVGIVDLFGVLWLIRRARIPINKEVTRYDD